MKILLLILLLIHVPGVTLHAQVAPKDSQESSKILPATKRSQIIALQKYKNLNDNKSELYKNYRNLLQSAVKNKNPGLNDPNWPLILAERAYNGTTTLARGPVASGLTRIERYEKEVQELIKSKDKLVSTWAKLEWASYTCWLAGDSIKEAELSAKQTELLINSESLKTLAGIRSELSQLNLILYNF